MRCRGVRARTMNGPLPSRTWLATVVVAVALAVGACGDGSTVEPPPGDRLPCTAEGVEIAIVRGGGPHRFDCRAATTVVPDRTYTIDKDVILKGDGNLIVDGGGNRRVFFITAGVTAEIHGFEIAGGFGEEQEPGSEGGGAILNAGSLTVEDCVVTGAIGGGVLNMERARMTIRSSTISGNEIGIRNLGVLTLADSAVVENAGAGLRNERFAEMMITDSQVTGNQGGGIVNVDSSLTVTGALVSENLFSGVVNENGALVMRDSTLADNRAGEDGGGGGILHSGPFGSLTLANVTISGNAALERGGGILDRGADASITNTTISGNSSGRDGGGLYCEPDSQARLTNVTLSGNTANSLGGAIFNEGRIGLTNVTVSANEAIAGTGISNEGSVEVSNSIVEGDCTRPLISRGFNVQGPGNECGFSLASDLNSVSAEGMELGLLADNGGKTQTHALGAGSVALDIIPPADCVDLENAEIDTDQRGVTRPQGTGCDAGAFELVR